MNEGVLQNEGPFHKKKVVLPKAYIKRSSNKENFFTQNENSFASMMKTEASLSSQYSQRENQQAKVLASRKTENFYLAYKETKRDHSKKVKKVSELKTNIPLWRREDDSIIIKRIDKIEQPIKTQKERHQTSPTSTLNVHKTEKFKGPNHMEFPLKEPEPSKNIKKVDERERAKYGLMDPKEDLEYFHASLNNSTDETRCFTDGHVGTQFTHKRVILKPEENRVKTENCNNSYITKHVNYNHARINSLANLPYDTNLSCGFFQNKPSFSLKKEKEIHHMRNKPFFTSLPEGVNKAIQEFQKDYKQRKPFELSKRIGDIIEIEENCTPEKEKIGKGGFGVKLRDNIEYAHLKKFPNITGVAASNESRENFYRNLYDKSIDKSSLEIFGDTNAQKNQESIISTLESKSILSLGEFSHFEHLNSERIKKMMPVQELEVVKAVEDYNESRLFKKKPQLPNHFEDVINSSVNKEEPIKPTMKPNILDAKGNDLPKKHQRERSDITETNHERSVRFNISEKNDKTRISHSFQTHLASKNDLLNLNTSGLECYETISNFWGNSISHFPLIKDDSKDADDIFQRKFGGNKQNDHTHNQSQKRESFVFRISQENSFFLKNSQQDFLTAEDDDDICNSDQIAVDTSEKKELSGGLSTPEKNKITLAAFKPDDYLTTLIEEVLNNLILKEEQYTFDPHYFNKQKDINSLMRSILVDWMMEVSADFMMKKEAFQTAVYIMDMYLATNPNVKRGSLQLVGVSSLYLANKLEDRRIPGRVIDFAKSCDDGYSQEEIKEFEIELIQALNFKLNPPTLVAYSNIYLSYWDFYIEKSMYAQNHSLVQSIGFENLQFRKTNEQAYKRFREFMQLIDTALLEVQTLEYKARALIGSFLYLLLGVYFGQFETEQIFNDFPFSSLFLFQDHMGYNNLFNDFLNKSFGYAVVDLLPTIQYCASYFRLKMNYELPQAAKLNLDTVIQSHFEEFLAYQTHHPEALEYVKKRKQTMTT